MNALKTAAIGAEIAVVSSLAVSSYRLAGMSWLAAAPLGTLIALETLRVPLAFRLPKARPLALIGGAAMLAGLSVITGEAASLAFTDLIYQRSRPALEAERDLKRAEIARDALAVDVTRRAEEVSRLTTDIETARRHRADIDKPPALMTAPTGRTCAGRHGSWNCGAAVQAEAVRANAAAQKAHADELRDASAQVKAAEARLAGAAPAPDMRTADQTVAEARRNVATERAANPMFRTAAAWERTPVEELTSESYSAVVHYAVIALASATALSTALAALISALPERGSRPGKFTLALRRWVAARRRKIRVEFRDRVRMVYVPVDGATGRIIDPDGKLGETVGGSSP